MGVSERTELEELRRLEQLEKIGQFSGENTGSMSLIDRIRGRFDTMGEAVESDQGLPRTAYQVAGQALGIPADVVGEGLSFAGRSINQLTGGMAGEALGDAVSYAGSTLGKLPSFGGGTIGERLPNELAPILESASDSYDSLTPGQKRDLEATANIAGAVMPLLGRGKQMAGAVKQIPAGLKAKRVPIRTSQQMRAAAGTKLSSAKNSGAVFSKKFGDDFIDTANNTLKRKGKWTKAVARNEKFDDFLDRLGELKGLELDLEDMAELDSYLGDLAYDTTDIAGNLTSEGRKFAQLQRVLRQKVDDAASNRPDFVKGNKAAIEKLKQGRAEWSRAVRMQDIERIIRKAQRTQQPAGALRTGFKNLIESDPQLRGYTFLEKSAIVRAAETGTITDTLKTLGSRLVPIGAGASAGPAGFVAGEAVSNTARGLGTASQMARARAVQSLLSQPAASQATPEIGSSLGTLGAQFIRSGVPVGSQIAIEDQPINQLEYYELFGE